MALDARLVDLLGEEHPLVLELASLRQAVAHYQVEAHKATVQLQHQSLEARSAIGSLNAIKEENKYLQGEVNAYRSSAALEKGSCHDTLLAQELTLALRRLSDKLDLTEKELSQKNELLIVTEGERDVAVNAKDSAVEAVNQLRMELEACHSSKRELLNRVKHSEEQRRMTDLVVDEYAALVRSLEGRPYIRTSSSSQRNAAEDLPSKNTLDGLMYARQGLSKLLQDSNSDTEKLHAEIARLHEALDTVNMTLDAERKAAMEARRKLAQVQLELERHKLDDSVAAKMVSRYMKFSQSSTDLLHGTIENLKARHAVTISTYEARLQRSEKRLASECRQTDHLRRALDELTEDISREAYGRRREISLRLALLGREERLSERIRRWLLKSQEILQKTSNSVRQGETGTVPIDYVIAEARDIITDTDGVLGNDGSVFVGSAARIHAAENAVAVLREELQKETDRRLYFQHQLAVPHFHPAHPPLLTPKSINANISRASASVMSSVISDASHVTSEKFTSENHYLEKKLVTLAESDPVHDVSDQLLSESCSSLDKFSLEFDALRNLDDETLKEITSENQQELLIHKGTTERTHVQSPSSPSLQLLVNLDSQDEIHNIPTPDKGTEEPILIKDETIVRADTAAAVENFGFEHKPEEGQNIASLHSSPVIMVTGISAHECTEDISTSGVRTVFTVPEITTNSLHLEGQETDHFGMSQEDRHKSQVSLNSPANKSISIGDKTDDILEDSPFARQALDSEFGSLLSRLVEVNQRYNEYYQSFRDCHLSLQQLKQKPNDVSGPQDALHSVIQRLSDYCEDARVELEIRIADEERISRGYQTIFTVPGALSDEVNQSELKGQVEAFINGTDATVQRTQDMLRHKLDDLQHDIACVKRAIYESSSPLLHPESAVQNTEEKTKVSSWPTWTNSIFPSSRPSSPAPSFGAVMTSPRLRHSSSSQRIRENHSDSSLISGMGLRIPMPTSLQTKFDIPPTPSSSFSRGTPRQFFGLGLRGGLLHGRSSMTFNYDQSNIPLHNTDPKDLDSDVE